MTNAFTRKDQMQIDAIPHLLVVTDNDGDKTFELDHPGCATKLVELDSISGDREAVQTYERHTCRMQHVVDEYGLAFLEHEDGEVRGWSTLEPGVYQIVSYSAGEGEVGARIVAPLPESESIEMRPVWRRRQRRVHLQAPLGFPTEAEIQDAIKVLEDADNETFAPALHLEAFAIFDEASK